MNYSTVKPNGQNNTYSFKERRKMHDQSYNNLCSFEHLKDSISIFGRHDVEKLIQINK